MPLQVRPGWTIPDDELAWQFARSGGPGGQHVNTSDTKARVSFDIAGSRSLAAAREVWRSRAIARLGASVSVSASEHRSQWRNREDALDRLADRLRKATDPPPAPRRATKPSRGAVERRIANKKRQASRKADRRIRDD